MNILERYAHLLVHYCLEIKKGDRLFVSTTVLAEPLLREVFRLATRAGAMVDSELIFREQNRILLAEANEQVLSYVSPLYRKAMEEYDAFLSIRAPYNLREDQENSPEKTKIRQEALKPILKTYFERTATRSLRRNLCQYPTQASAQEAGMSLEAYEHFIFGACRLFEDDPVKAWLGVREKQQTIVDFLNQKTHFRYLTADTDLSFSTEGRKWINSDGQTNMPSGEVYTSPVENAVNGIVHFDYPAVYMGHEVQGVRLWVKDGWIEKWEARQGQDFLDNIFQIEGTRRFGEAAIGTNDQIRRFTKNILFDEKIGGTIHLAIGQSYLQCGGQNQSTIHWDMIADMTKGGAIFADGEKIYENGRFLFV